MTATLLANELSSLISESKRKNGDIRAAAERSLQDLKSLSITSDQQLAGDLSRRQAFIDPFVIACRSQNARYAGIGVTCLQRLVVLRGLHKSRLKDAIESFNACTGLGLDVQLKILQALPSLVQNYDDELKDRLLSGTLQICSSLQAAKVQTISGVAAATFQQLVATVFEKVSKEDARGAEIPAEAHVPGLDGSIALRPAAFDAYRVFRDLILVAGGRTPKFVDFTLLSIEASLELIYSCISSNPRLVESHQELASIVRSNVLPFITQALSEKSDFTVTVRCTRILRLILLEHLTSFSGECEIALGLVAHGLEADASLGWKRCLLMEVVRDVFEKPDLVIKAYASFDDADDGKPIIQDILSAFVRLSTEKPTIIGLGQQSTIPTGPKDQAHEQAAIESAGGMAGVISSALGVMEASVPGLSSQWSIPRTACIDQLDKREPPSLPETYLYSLVLVCLGHLSDNLARVVLPLSVQHERSKGKTMRDATEAKEPASGDQPPNRLDRSQSFRRRAVPMNPLDIGSVAPSTKAVAGLIESCWPAILATSSTFLNAALDDQYYRNLIKAYQRFAQVAGLLRLSTPRDALITTLGKAAVPPQVLNAATADGARSPSVESPRVFSNPRNLLSVDSLINQASTTSSDRDRRPSAEPARQTLTIRNLLCLRALLNLAIALGPTLGHAFSVVVDVLKQADIVLSAVGPQQLARQGAALAAKGTESPAIVQAFSAEVAAVESAASRLLESTADYPDDSFLVVLETFCGLLYEQSVIISPSSPHHPPSLMNHPPGPRRTFSGLHGISTNADMRIRDYQFAIPKLGTLAALNVARFVSTEPAISGWNTLVGSVMGVVVTNANPPGARRAASDLLCNLANESIAEVAESDATTREAVQQRALAVLLGMTDGIYIEDGELTSTDIDVQCHVLSSLKSILDRSGESLISGWDAIMIIMSTVFEGEREHSDSQHDQDQRPDWTQISNELISVRLGTASFDTLRSICSDFLDNLPPAVMPSLIELLHRFMGQRQDLNLSLAALNTVWALSDVLSQTSLSAELETLGPDADGISTLEHRMAPSLEQSRSTQWLLLLLRLRETVRIGQQETRKAAFQTICSICKNRGGDLSPGAWSMLLSEVVLGLLKDQSTAAIRDGHETDGTDGGDSTDMTCTIVSGTTAVLAQNVRLIGQITNLSKLWQVFMSSLGSILDRNDLTINAVVYKSLATMLADIELPLKSWQQPVDGTFDLWARRTPQTQPIGKDKSSNQTAFTAYTDLALELRRLTAGDIGSEQRLLLISNVYGCLQASDASYYNADVISMSSLQSKALELLHSLSTDQVHGSPTLISTAANMTVLHKETANQDARIKRPSYIALAGEAVQWLQSLMLNNLETKEWDAEAQLAGLTSLGDLIEAKYTVRPEYKGIMVWRRATTAAVAVVPRLLACANATQAKSDHIASIWRQLIRIAGAVVNANGLEDYDDVARIYQDQLADTEAFEVLRAVLTPHLGEVYVADEVRAEYVEALFRASIVHQTELGDMPARQEALLENLGKIRRGRVKKVPFSQREQMSYVCFSELIALSSVPQDSSLDIPKVAQTAAPWLILRLAIPIRAYIADQPLRGRAPQPLSELEELLFCFEQIGKLKLHPKAMPRQRVSGESAHLAYLYPLMAKAVSTAADQWSGAGEVLEPLQAVLESLIPFAG